MTLRRQLRQRLLGTAAGQAARRARNRLRRYSTDLLGKAPAPLAPRPGEAADLTTHYDYDKLIAEEKTHYSDIEITEDLKEGGVHAHTSWQHYWQRVQSVLDQSDYGDIAGFLDQSFSDRQRPIRILSLGSGYCGQEIAIAERLKSESLTVCTDVNEELFDQAKKVAEQKGLRMEFRAADLNFIEIEPDTYDFIFAHAVLHHVINLERLFDQVMAGLTAGGLFHMVEVVGMNRKLIWDENEKFANALLASLPKSVTKGFRLAVPFEDHGMEGVRQEDIMPLLAERFEPIYEYGHGAFMRFICTDADIGPCFDPSNEHARNSLDFLIDCDAAAVRNRVLRPLEVWGLYRARSERRSVGNEPMANEIPAGSAGT